MDETDPPEPSPFAIHRIPNGFVVLLAVALLLQGPVGAFGAFWTYTKSFVGTLFGGEELFWEVLCQTAPLALSMAAVTFAMRCRWITFRDFTSVLAVAVIILTATWFGGELRSFNAKNHAHAIPGAQVIPASTITDVPTQLASAKLNAMPTAAAKDVLSVHEAMAILTDLNGAATDVRHHQWSDPIPRVDAIPGEGDSATGLAAKAINQLLGYFVVYGPRLFFAAILLGCYIGWTWQPYFQSITAWLERRRSVDRPPAS
ncbi:MAG: hypothetical protein ACR2NZ_11375 [Rubripirellula sp.]